MRSPSFHQPEHVCMYIYIYNMYRGLVTVYHGSSFFVLRVAKVTVLMGPHYHLPVGKSDCPFRRLKFDNNTINHVSPCASVADSNSSTAL